jgi:hypothetical protein
MIQQIKKFLQSLFRKKTSPIPEIEMTEMSKLRFKDIPKGNPMRYYLGLDLIENPTDAERLGQMRVWKHLR